MLRQDFNKGWSFGNYASSLSALVKGIRKTSQPVDLPHDAMIATARTADSVVGGGGGYFQGENYEYVKQFEVPEEDRGKVILLEFEGVYMNAFVYVNGDLAGKHYEGYSNFYVPIHDFLRYGKTNEIKVVVKNGAQPNTRWYSGAGIYRNVHLLKAEPIHIAVDGVRITTLEAEPDLAVLRLDIEVVHEHLGQQTGYVTTVIRDADGQVVSEERTKFSVTSQDRVQVRQRITLQSPKLWSIDHPYLYTCETRVQIGERVTDEDMTTFGIRKLQLDSVYGLRINGQVVKLKGGCIHHDNGVIGAAAFADAEDRRIRKLKEAGYNAIRSAHHPMGRTLLDACDRHGMLVMEELADVWTNEKVDFDAAFTFSDHWEQDVERMVAKCYNHPSVILYSIGNELAENGSPHGNRLGRKIVEKIRSLDETRYITNGVNLMISALGRLGDLAAELGMEGLEAREGGEINDTMQALGPLMAKLMQSPLIHEMVEESFGLLDVSGYNYSPHLYELEHRKFPNRVFVGTETYPASLDKNWEIVMRNGYVIGDFSWTAWDYLGEVGIGRVRYQDAPDPAFYGTYPWVTAMTGDFDITGYRLPISYWREIIWGGRGHTPYIAVQKPERYGQDPVLSNWGWTDSISSWTWPGYEGKGIVVEVYSNAEEVELFINGVSQGRQPVGTDFKRYYCRWDTRYEPGNVEAVAYIGGEEAGRFSLRTAGEPGLRVTKERESLRAGSNDLCYVNIELADKNGILHTAADRKVTVSIEGPATILGSGTGRPRTEENFFDHTHETYHGRMLVVVRAGAETGVARLTATADGLDAVTVEIPVV
jgi:beta-galactosidase